MLNITTGHTKQVYHMEYNTFNRLRWLAYRECGGKKDPFEWFDMVAQDKTDLNQKFCDNAYTNLMNHSDSDGVYKIGVKHNTDILKIDYEEGNIEGLLAEVRMLKTASPFIDVGNIGDKNILFKSLTKLVTMIELELAAGKKKAVLIFN